MAYKTLHDTILFPTTLPLVYAPVTVCVCVCLCVLYRQSHYTCSWFRMCAMVIVPFTWLFTAQIFTGQLFITSIERPSSTLQCFLYLLIYYISLHSTYDYKNISYLRTEMMSILFTLRQVLTKCLAHIENSVAFCLINKQNKKDS